jgi:hypothetical protein
MRVQTLQALQGERLLAAWECCLDQHDLERALTLLMLALPDARREELAALPIAERNLLMLRLRNQSFGPHLEGVAICARCTAPVEFSLAVTTAIAGLERRRTEDSVEWLEDRRRMKMRPANTLDLLSSLDEPQPEAAESLLLARCTSVEGIPGEDQDLARLPSVREHFEQLNSASELRCCMTCPHCAHSEILELDIAHFVWAEVRHAAQQLLSDIHILASNYGWHELDIANMSARRRNMYLELLGA